MKKFLAVILALVVVCTAFVACSKGKGDDKNTTEGKPSTTTGIATEKAKIKEGEAIDFIEKAYTKEELGLENVKENYSFMVAQNAVEIDGDRYIKVAANVMAQNEQTNKDGQVTYSLTPVGEYYISFDGKKVLSKDLESGEYKKLKNKYDEYKKNAKNTTAADSKKETKKAK